MEPLIVGVCATSVHVGFIKLVFDSNRKLPLAVGHVMTTLLPDRVIDSEGDAATLLTARIRAP